MGDSSTITDWISAIATALAAATSLIALGAAGYAARYTKKMWEVERERDARQADEARRRQASSVVALAARTKEPLFDPDDQYLFDIDIPCVRIINRSDLPIYDVTLESPKADHAEVAAWPEATPLLTSDRSQHRREVIALDSTVDIPLTIDAVRPYFDDALRRDESDLEPDQLCYAACRCWESAARPTITFTDAAGNRWRRDSTGALSLIHQVRPPA